MVGDGFPVPKQNGQEDFRFLYPSSFLPLAKGRIFCVIVILPDDQRGETRTDVQRDMSLEFCLNHACLPLIFRRIRQGNPDNRTEKICRIYFSVVDSG